MIYLSSTTNIPEKYQWNQFGIMFSAKYTIGGLNDALDAGALWMMDNNEFAGGFDAKLWYSALIKYLPYQSTCLGIPIRDKVGDALETIRLFSRYYQSVKDLGYKVAFVSQDGITPEITPWDYFDVLFVGGSDEHKLGIEAITMIAEAKGRGKWVHIGRVNSSKRIKEFWMADSVDGTHLTMLKQRTNGEGRTEQLDNETNFFATSVEYCRNKKSGKLGTNGQYTIMQWENN